MGSSTAHLRSAGSEYGASIQKQNAMVHAWSQSSTAEQYKQLQQTEDWTYRAGQTWVDMQGSKLD